MPQDLALKKRSLSTTETPDNTPGDGPPSRIRLDERPKRRSPYQALAWPAVAAVGGVALFELARARFQRSQMFAPTRFPEGRWDPNSHGVPAEDVWFETADGVRLHGWWTPAAGTRTTVIYCHGNTGSVADRLDVLAELCKLDVNLFAFGYRGYGRSEGAPSPEGVKIDVCAAIDYVSSHHGVRLEDLVLFGHSLGGAVAIQGAHRRKVAGLIVQSSFTDIASMARAYFPKLPMHLVARNYLQSIAIVPHLEMPKLFIHGTEDETVPHFHGEHLFAAAAEPKTFISVPGGMHNDLHITARDVWFDAGRHFIERCTA